jgi:hypothetical protein
LSYFLSIHIAGNIVPIKTRQKSATHKVVRIEGRNDCNSCDNNNTRARNHNAALHNDNNATQTFSATSMHGADCCLRASNPVSNSTGYSSSSSSSKQQMATVKWSVWYNAFGVVRQRPQHGRNFDQPTKRRYMCGDEGRCNRDRWLLIGSEPVPREDRSPPAFTRCRFTRPAWLARSLHRVRTVTVHRGLLQRWPPYQTTIAVPGPCA